MPGRNLQHGRDLATANPHRQRAARMEAASRWRIGEIWRAAFQSPAGRVIADTGEAGNKVSGVGVQWITENLRRCSLFDETPRIHDAEAVSHMRVDAHVMGDEQDRRANLALNAANHTEHLLLHQDIERGRGFVGDNEIGATDRGERKRGALTHAAGQLMG